MDELINYWGDFIDKIDDSHREKYGFIHRRDSKNFSLEKEKGKRKFVLFKNYEAMVSKYDEFSCESNENAIHAGLLPQPYHGNIKKASVILLLLNPGVGACDYKAECDNNIEYREEIIRTFHQSGNRHMLLDPKWSWTGGFKWWEGKFRSIVRFIKDEKNLNYIKALEMVSENVASIELFPYHSRGSGAFIDCESTDRALKSVKNTIESHSQTKVIALRGVDRWGKGIGPAFENVFKLNPSECQSASLKVVKNKDNKISVEESSLAGLMILEALDCAVGDLVRQKSDLVSRNLPSSTTY